MIPKKTPAVLLALLLMGALQPLSAQEPVEMTIEGIPETVEEFITLRDSLGQTPEGGALLTVIAMIKYAEDPSEGLKFFTVMLNNDGSQLRKASKGGYQGMEPSATNQYLIGKLKDAPWIAHSYLSGTGSVNAYAPPAYPWKVRIIRRSDAVQSDGSVKLFILSSGADSPRPLRLKKNDRGIWKVAEFSSLFVDVRRPDKPADEL